MKLLPCVLVAVAFSSVTWAGTLSEAEKITRLIKTVEEMPARFIRNGTEYDAQEAAAHLRRKLRKAGSRIKTAEDFIQYCGSRSSMSGEKYKIKSADGRVIESEIYLRERLKEIEAGVEF
jgi:hypothetical protein